MADKQTGDVLSYFHAEIGRDQIFLDQASNLGFDANGRSALTPQFLLGSRSYLKVEWIYS